MFPPNKEAEMRVIFPTLVGLAALAAVSAQAAPNLSTAYPHETPTQNVWKSQQYDYLLRTNGNFRAYRMRRNVDRSEIPGCVAAVSPPSALMSRRGGNTATSMKKPRSTSLGPLI